MCSSVVKGDTRQNYVTRTGCQNHSIEPDKGSDWLAKSRLCMG